MNWDDLKYFLMVCNTGSIRSAAKMLGVNHATVSRRINSFEESLGQRLFDRTPQGYVRTAAAEDIYTEASHLEERLNTVQRRVAGKDTTLSGDIRVTLPELLGQKLFVPDIADFCALYPGIEIEIVDSVRPFNLANREADVAFRLCDQPPEYLVGRKLANVHRACYVSRRESANIESEEWLAQQNWIGWTDKQRRPIGKLAREYHRFESKHKIISAGIQIEACKSGMGISILPCFVADNDPELMRIPPYTSEHKYDLWVLSHPDLRKNAKIQAFIRFMTERMMQKRPLIEGEVYQAVSTSI